MDFQDVRAFLRVAERESFTAAALQLGWPLTSISRRVKSLEEELGVQLVYRTTRRVWVTDAGREFYIRCLEAETKLIEAEKIAKAHIAEPGGTLRVLVPYTLGLVVLEPKLVEFRRLYPKIQLVLTYDNYPLDLVENGFDIALRVGDPTQTAYTIRHIGWSRAVFVASPAYLSRAGRPAAPADLLAHPIMLRDADVPVARLVVRHSSGDEVTLMISPALVSNESTTIMKQVLGGAGIGMLSPQLIEKKLHSGELEIVLPQWHRAQDAEISLLFPRQTVLDPKIAVFIEFISEMFSPWTVTNDRRDLAS